FVPLEIAEFYMPSGSCPALQTPRQASPHLSLTRWYSGSSFNINSAFWAPECSTQLRMYLGPDRRLQNGPVRAIRRDLRIFFQLLTLAQFRSAAVSGESRATNGSVVGIPRR